MGRGFTMGRVGHIGVQVTDIDRSFEFYTETLGLTLTGR
jgi:catechol 2,3-dioxygenase-like lactoylglutathione lyase family enzyme